jgi:hypothetical protein
MGDWNNKDFYVVKTNKLQKTYIQGFLDISGGKLMVRTDDVSFNRNFYVMGDVSLNLNLNVKGSVNARTYNVNSDYRNKTNIKLLDNSYTIDNFRPVIYNHNNVNKKNIGFIAHEVQEHYPFLVNGEKDANEEQTINYMGIIGILVKEIQELKKEVKELKNSGFFV